MTAPHAKPERFDTAVIGGGVMGCTVALHLARAGQRVAVLERGQLFRQGSGVNAGTLAMQTKTPFMIPYHMRSWELWRDAKQWLGRDAGFGQRGSLNLAMTEDEAHALDAAVRERVAAGAPIEFIGANRALEIEPNISPRARLYSYTAMDGYASPLLAGLAYRHALVAAGVRIHDGFAVDAITREARGFECASPAGRVRTARLVLAVGPWLEPLTRQLGVHLPMKYRVVQMIVTERAPRLFHPIVSSATNMLSLKQADNGAVLIGGGWEAEGTVESGAQGVYADAIIDNLRLAHAHVPALAGTRIARTWSGIVGRNADKRPIIGPVPGVPDAYVIGGVRSGFTGGPLLGKLLAQQMLSATPEMSLAPFDPMRFAAAQSQPL